MPQYLFIYTIDGEQHFSNYQAKIALSKDKQIKAAKKLFFKEREIKVWSREIKEEE